MYVDAQSLAKLLDLASKMAHSDHAVVCWSGLRPLVYKLFGADIENYFTRAFFRSRVSFALSSLGLRRHTDFNLPSTGRLYVKR